MSKEDFSLLLETYRQHPCRVLPNAFWKTAKKIDQCRMTIARGSSGALIGFIIQEESHIYACWCKEPQDLLPQRLGDKKISFALVHQDCLEIVQESHFSQRTAYFRLLYRGSPPDTHCPGGFHYETVNPHTDLSRATSFINQCYQNIRVDEKIVESWLDHPVYDPNLWVWIKDTQNQIAALGIAEIDSRVPEASLEWVQVHPGYQGKGLGSALVAELLRRAAADVKFTTVSGEVHNPSDPEKLYRRMGFSGSDVWWLLKP